MYGAYAVSHFKTVLIPSLDNAREAVSFGKSHYVYLVALGASFDGKHLSHRIFGEIVHSELFQYFLRFYARFFELSVVGLVEVFLLRFAETDFDRLVTVFFLSLDLDYRAGTCLDDRYGDYFSVGGKDLRHS